MEEKSKGLGDTIAKITQATGLDKVAHIVAKEAAKKEFDETYKKISLGMTQNEFQHEVGRLEVLGELLIREK